jgi:hypothetical protein
VGSKISSKTVAKNKTNPWLKNYSSERNPT